MDQKIEPSETDASELNEQMTPEQKKRLKNRARRQRYKSNKKMRKEEELKKKQKEEELKKKQEEENRIKLLSEQTPYEIYTEEEEKLDLIDFRNILDEKNLEDLNEWKNKTYKIKLKELYRKINNLEKIEDINTRVKVFKEYSDEKKCILNLRFSLLTYEEKKKFLIIKKRARKAYESRKKLKEKLNEYLQQGNIIDLKE